MPRLDPAPVRLGVDGAHAADRAFAHQLPRRLLRLSEECRRRGAEPNAAPVGKLRQFLCFFVAERDGLLRMDVLSCLEALRGDLGVRLRRGEVDDGVDRVVCEQRLERGVDGAAELVDELGRPAGHDVGRAGELEQRRGRDRLRVAGGDVAAADERDPHRSHSRSSPSI